MGEEDPPATNVLDEMDEEGDEEEPEETEEEKQIRYNIAAKVIDPEIPLSLIASRH